MTRIFNFSAGPAVLPESVLRQAQAEMLDWHESGMGVMEMSHRGKEFDAISAEAEADLRELMAIPNNYKVLFLQGGATQQFAAVPMNLLGDNDTADYVNTGAWSKKAISEAKKYCKVNVVASSESSNFSTIPAQAEWKRNANAAYLHYTPNETIGGVEFHWVPDSGETPLVADMSSTILSRPIDVSKFGLIYAGAQKNIGPAGLTLVIVRDDLIGKAKANVPTMIDYKPHAEDGSKHNTPPTYAWYMAGLVFKWLKGLGGLAGMAAINERKANKIYNYVDGSGFYSNPVDKACRSWMNIPFLLKNADLDKAFLAEAKNAGFVQLAGHRSVGGMRASVYNAMPEEGVDKLVEFMKDFARRNG